MTTKETRTKPHMLVALRSGFTVNSVGQLREHTAGSTYIHPDLLAEEPALGEFYEEGFTGPDTPISRAIRASEHRGGSEVRVTAPGRVGVVD